jgi:excisionase family DNA binding protein
MPGPAIRCPSCGHALLTVDEPAIPVSSPGQARQSADTPAGPLLLRVAKAAELLSISRSSLYQLIASGEVRVVRLGRTVRIPRQMMDSSNTGHLGTT